MILNIDTGTGHSAGIHSKKKTPHTHMTNYFLKCVNITNKDLTAPFEHL